MYMCVLFNYVGLISEAPIKSKRDFHTRVRKSKTKGRLLSLDIKSLYTNIPVNEAIEVIRMHSSGPNPMFENLPVAPDIFCDLLKMCSSFNQFTFGNKYYRQITGVPMGSSLSPALANIYMEYFETCLLDDIPVDMKPELWLRFVDDIFCCYGDMDKFEAFLELLNNINPSIQFTHELSRMDKCVPGSPDLPADVIESLPFLELTVMRQTNGDITFSIYRKPCHAGNYLHAYSYQPISQKSTVIRSLYLRAYRYCDSQFLEEELLQIQQGFIPLGYTREFIEKCRVSAFKGRMNEIKKDNLVALQELPFACHSVITAVKQEPLATLVLPYRRVMLKMQPRLNEQGIRLCFSSNSTIGQQLRHKSNTFTQPRGSVYVVNCSDCDLVYVGQTGQVIEDRMTEHNRSATDDSQLGALKRHNLLPDHTMDLENPTQVFHSDCKTTRCTVEAALIHVAPTVTRNTATASIDNNDMIAPVVCRATRFNWKKLANTMPQLSKKAIPRHRKLLFGGQIIRPPRNVRSLPPTPPVAGRTRSHGPPDDLDFSS